MRRLMSSLLVVGLVFGAGVQSKAEEEHPSHGKADAVVSTALIGAWAVGASVATSGLRAAFAEYTVMGVFVGGMLVGAYLSYSTDPERTGRGFRYNRQDKAEGEDRKFENDPTNPGWKRLKAYPVSGPTTIRPMTEDEVHQAWMRKFDVVTPISRI